MSSTPKSSNSQEAFGPLFHPFDPIIDSHSKILILGTFPSIKSFENAFYYGHPQNQFWKILASIFGEVVPQTIDEKIAFLRRHRIALWDMVASCERKDSLDSSLKKITPNDIAALLERYPNIEVIFCTGKKSFELFERHFTGLRPAFYLPSPSPAHRTLSLERKVEIWRELLGRFLEISEGKKEGDGKKRRKDHP